MDQPQSALVLDNELFASAREQWQQSSGSASTSGQTGDYYSLLGVSRVSTAFTVQQDKQVARMYRAMSILLIKSQGPCLYNHLY